MMSRRDHLPAFGLTPVALLLALAASPCAADDAAAAPDTRTLLDRFDSEFIDITPGSESYPDSFRMGSPDGPASERPQHKVALAYRFAMARYEVPQNLYAAVMGANPSRWKGARNSVEMVSWNDARAFCRKCTELMREANLIEDDERIRLPSEPEWEYGCRAGTQTAYSFGANATRDGDKQNQASVLDEYAWHTGNAAGNDPPVGALKPNAWGLYDMHGYLWEYTADDWHDDYAEAPADGRAWTAGNGDGPVVIRGGSWRDRFDEHRSASRKQWPRDATSDAVGFRCVKVRQAR